MASQDCEEKTKDEMWYEEILNDRPLSQGDVLENCPIIISLLDDNGELQLYESETDLIILSQACDIANKKIPNILGVEIFKLDEVYESLIKEEVKNRVEKLKEKGEAINLEEVETSERAKCKLVDFCDDVSKNKYFRYHMLNEKSDGDIRTDFRIIDFSKIHMINIDHLNKIKSTLGNRLRLQSPYKEFVSQRFGAFYSRIGLPTGINDKVLEQHTKKLRDLSILEKNKGFYSLGKNGEYISNDDAPKEVKEAIKRLNSKKK